MFSFTPNMCLGDHSSNPEKSVDCRTFFSKLSKLNSLGFRKNSFDLCIRPMLRMMFVPFGTLYPSMTSSDSALRMVKSTTGWNLRDSLINFSRTLSFGRSQFLSSRSPRRRKTGNNHHSP